MQHARGGDGLDRDVAIAHHQPLVAIPQHDAIAVGFVDENDGKLVLRVADDESVRSMPRRLSSARTRRPFSSVPVTPAYLARSPRRAHAHIAVAICPPQRISCRSIFIFANDAERLRIARQQVNVVDGVGADADDIPRSSVFESRSRPSSGRSITPGVRVRFEGVSKHLARTRRSRGVDLDVEAGECLVLLGPSGCGKTTLLRLLAGLERADAGRIWIGDRVVNDIEPAARDVAMVFQNYALYPHFTVFENIAFPLRARKRAPLTSIDRRVRAAAARVGLEAAARSPAGAAFRRSAAARRAGARDRPKPCRLPDGRAALEPRCAAAAADTDRAQAPASGARHDDGLRDA